MLTYESNNFETFCSIALAEYFRSHGNLRNLLKPGSRANCAQQMLGFFIVTLAFIFFVVYMFSDVLIILKIA